MPADNPAFHPGEYVKEELIARGWSWGSFAEQIGWSLEDLTLLIDGRIDITNHHAMDLSRVFSTSISLWLRLQITWDRMKEGS